MHSKSSGASNTHHKYVNSSWRDCGRLQGVRGDIVPALVIRCSRERAAFSKGGIAWVVYLFLHHDGAFIIFTPRVHTSVIFVPASPLPPFPWQCRKIPWQRSRYRVRRTASFFLLSFGGGYYFLSCRVWFSMILEDPYKTRYRQDRLCRWFFDCRYVFEAVELQ